MAAAVRRLPAPLAQLAVEGAGDVRADATAAEVARAVRADEVEGLVQPLAAGGPVQVERVEIRVGEDLDERLGCRAVREERAPRPFHRAAPDAADEAHTDTYGLRSGLELSEAGLADRLPAPRARL